MSDGNKATAEIKLCCSCTFEERDSACVVHPSCEECGESTDLMVRSCADHGDDAPMTALGNEGR